MKEKAGKGDSHDTKRSFDFIGYLASSVFAPYILLGLRIFSSDTLAIGRFRGRIPDCPAAKKLHIDKQVCFHDPKRALPFGVDRDNCIRQLYGSKFRKR